jgi:hypothetical protein
MSLQKALQEKKHGNMQYSGLLCMRAGSDPTKLIEELSKRKKLKCLGVSMVSLWEWASGPS